MRLYVDEVAVRSCIDEVAVRGCATGPLGGRPAGKQVPTGAPTQRLVLLPDLDGLVVGP